MQNHGSTHDPRARRRERTVSTTRDPHKHEQSYYSARTEPNDRCPARARLAWVLLGGAACAARNPSTPHHTQPTKQRNGTRQAAPQTTNEARREHREATRMPNKMEPNVKLMPAECGGVTTPPLLSTALRLQTARGKSGHWSHRSHPVGAGAIACASCVIGQAQNV